MILVLHDLYGTLFMINSLFSFYPSSVSELHLIPYPLTQLVNILQHPVLFPYLISNQISSTVARYAVSYEIYSYSPRLSQYVMPFMLFLYDMLWFIPTKPP